MYCKSKILIVFLFFFLCISCIERGKPTEKESTKRIEKNGQKKLAHYICPNGHAGSDKQGICPECNTAYQHNQAFHGLNIPQNSLKDPFKSSTGSQTTTSPAQNSYGDYHYICPNGHAGGSGSADNCATCNAKLTHNQLYHK